MLLRLWHEQQETHVVVVTQRGVGNGMVVLPPNIQQVPVAKRPYFLMVVHELDVIVPIRPINYQLG